LLVNKFSRELKELPHLAEEENNALKTRNLTRLLSTLVVSLLWLNYDINLVAAIVYYFLFKIPIHPHISVPLFKQLQKYGPFSVNNTKLLESSEVKIKDLLDPKKMLQLALNDGLHKNPSLIVKFIRTELPLLQKKFRKQYEDQVTVLEIQIAELKCELIQVRKDTKLFETDKIFKTDQLNQRIRAYTNNLEFVKKSLTELDGLFQSAYESAIRIEQEQLKLAIGSVSKLGKNTNENPENPDEPSEYAAIMKELELELANDSILVRKILSAYEQSEEGIVTQSIEQPKAISS
jgi:hypothetical protein